MHTRASTSDLTADEWEARLEKVMAKSTTRKRIRASQLNRTPRVTEAERHVYVRFFDPLSAETKQRIDAQFKAFLDKQRRERKKAAS